MLQSPSRTLDTGDDYVRFWHKADIGLCAAHVCFRPKADIDPDQLADRSADLFRERILQIARLVLCGIDDDLPSAGEILIQPAAAHVLKLYHEEPRRCPFAAFVEADFSDDGLERVLVDVLCELVVVEAAGRGDRLFEHLHRGVGEGWLVETERVGSGAGRAFLVLLEEALNSGKT